MWEKPQRPQRLHLELEDETSASVKLGKYRHKPEMLNMKHPNYYACDNLSCLL